MRWPMACASRDVKLRPLTLTSRVTPADPPSTVSGTSISKRSAPRFSSSRPSGTTTLGSTVGMLVSLAGIAGVGSAGAAFLRHRIPEQRLVQLHGNVEVVAVALDAHHVAAAIQVVRRTLDVVLQAQRDLRAQLLGLRGFEQHTGRADVVARALLALHRDRQSQPEPFGRPLAWLDVLHSLCLP